MLTGKIGQRVWKEGILQTEFGELLKHVVDLADYIARLLGAFDPNDKTGPSGFSSAGFITPYQAAGYRIDFENEPSATSPAQMVTITDQLDTDLDWSTFSLTEISFGDHVVAIPAGSQHFQTTVPIVYNGVTFEVQIETGIDLATGRVYADFYSIDPGDQPAARCPDRVPPAGAGASCFQPRRPVCRRPGCRPWPWLGAHLVHGQAQGRPAHGHGDSQRCPDLLRRPAADRDEPG